MTQKTEEAAQESAQESKSPPVPEADNSGASIPVTVDLSDTTADKSLTPEASEGTPSNNPSPPSGRPPARKASGTSGQWKLNLDHANQKHLETGMQMMGMPPKSPIPTVAPEPELPPSSGNGREGEEVLAAADSLAGIVDQMIPSFLVSLGLLDTALKWLRSLAVGIGVGVLFGIFVAFRIEKAVQELDAANKEIRDLKVSLQGIMKEVQKVKGLSQIESQTSIQITAGDRPGEVNILAPQVTRADIEKEKRKIEAAVEAGKPIPLPTTALVTARIPVKINQVDTPVAPLKSAQQAVEPALSEPAASPP
ncbi:MAG TPA: hypothetical protein VIE65_10850 [Methylobacter sp.]|jgi:hypothetical protein